MIFRVKPKNKETFAPPLVGFLLGCFFTVSNLASAECPINSKLYHRCFKFFSLMIVVVLIASCDTHTPDLNAILDTTQCPLQLKGPYIGQSAQSLNSDNPYSLSPAETRFAADQIFRPDDPWQIHSGKKFTSDDAFLIWELSETGIDAYANNTDRICTVSFSTKASSLITDDSDYRYTCIFTFRDARSNILTYSKPFQLSFQRQIHTFSFAAPIDIQYPTFGILFGHTGADFIVDGFQASFLSGDYCGLESQP